MIAKIKDNSIIYPTDIYEKYNLYLIDEYTKFLNNTDDAHENQKILIAKIIIELQELLDDNKPDPGTTEYVLKLLNVMRWEKQLVDQYKLLDKVNKYRGLKPLISIENFVRKYKLEKLSKAI